MLNTVRKILETVLARKITNLAKSHGLLPNSQIGNRKQRSTETALLLEQIYILGPQEGCIGALIRHYGGLQYSEPHETSRQPPHQRITEVTYSDH